MVLGRCGICGHPPDIPTTPLPGSLHAEMPDVRGRNVTSRGGSLAPEVLWGLSSGPSVSRQLDFRAEPTSSPPGFRLVGEVDLSNASQLGELLLAAVQVGGDVTLDLSVVSFIDRSGIQG